MMIILHFFSEIKVFLFFFLCNKLEDEFHVICECPRYDTCRKLYIKPYYVRIPSMDKLIQLLNTEMQHY